MHLLVIKIVKYRNVHAVFQKMAKYTKKIQNKTLCFGPIGYDSNL